MKENRWRSLSIMDLHLSKRGSFATTSGLSSSSSASSSSSSAAVSGANASSRPQSHQESVPLTNNGQSYELIKSTQSLVERLQLNAEDIAIQPVHPSIIGQDTWFQITYTTSGTTRYFSCQSPKERDEWISSLKKTLMLNEDRRRTDNSLKLDVLEIKGLGDKKKYYVEIMIDDKLYARTSSKKITDACCMWCESFSFSDLPQCTEKITLLVHKDKGGQSTSAAANSRKKPKKPVGRVKISVGSVTSRYVQDKWYQVEKSNRRESPSIRLRAQYQSIDILPLRDYEEFLYFLKDEYKNLCKLLEPTISIKVKEELANNLMNLFHAEEMAEDVLADLVVDEISNLENEHLTFRGNSIATKAMECYIKLVGEQYLLSTLQTVISDILSQQELDLEIDPIKVSSNEVLSLHRQSLYALVRQVWHKIVKSHAYFPWQLQRCFHKIRQVLAHIGKSEVGDKMISSCIFLRYLCPAILTPSLFKLTDEFPSEKANRNLTLVAKTLQTLANFSKYESKESSMEFLNQFLAEESETMRNYLKQISSPLAEDYWIPSLSSPVEKADLGKYLSSLHTILFENVAKLDSENAKSVKLTQLLDELNAILKRPTSSKLAQISQTTTTTLAKKNPQEPTTPEKVKTFAGIPIPWLGTLPKPKEKKIKPQNLSSDSRSNNQQSNGSMSVVAPHHATSGTTQIMVEQKSPGILGVPVAVQVPGGAVKPLTQALNTTLTDHVGVPLSPLGPESSDDSSITPSPNGQGRTTWRSGVGNAGDTSTSTSSSDILSSGMATTERQRLHTKPGLDPYRNRKSHLNHSSMSLDDTSSDDSTYSSQYQSDANSTPRTGTSQTLPRNLPKQSVIHHSGTHGNIGGIGLSNIKVKSMNDYEAEILHMRSEMEHLQIKLSEAERRLQFSNNNSQQQVLCSPGSDSTKIATEADQSSTNPPPINFSDQDMAKEVVQRLTKEEDKLRNDLHLGTPCPIPLVQSDSDQPISDKEKMILMQQKKIAALDAANRRLLEELNKISSSTGINAGNNVGSTSSGTVGTSSGAKVSVTTSPINVTSINTSSNTVSHDRRVSSSSTSSNKSITVITNGEATMCIPTNGGTSGTVSPTSNVKSSSSNNQSNSNSLPAQPTMAGSQEIPKRVEELLDSLHSTSI